MRYETVDDGNKQAPNFLLLESHIDRAETEPFMKNKQASHVNFLNSIIDFTFKTQLYVPPD
jgi:hypothetical protein